MTWCETVQNIKLLTSKYSSQLWCLVNGHMAANCMMGDDSAQ